jgi:hypothetical protein
LLGKQKKSYGDVKDALKKPNLKATKQIHLNYANKNDPAIRSFLLAEIKYKTSNHYTLNKLNNKVGISDRSSKKG